MSAASYKNDKPGAHDEEEVTATEPKESLQEEPVPPLNTADQLQKKIAEAEDKYLRLYADFENYKKRMVKEREDIRLSSQETLLRELLDVKDHLELALTHAANGGEVEGLREGVSLTLRQMSQFLEKAGVKELKSEGEMFDPARHEAIGQGESDATPGTVIQEFQKGYLFRDRLLRPARVLVAKEKG